jgi:FKBP-type peptidyl-prolyl cis-trans isomerase
MIRTLVLMPAFALGLLAAALPTAALGQDEEQVAVTQPATEPAATEPAADAPEEPGDLSYALGYSIGSRIASDLASQGIEIDPARFAQAISDALTGGEPQLSYEQIQQVMMNFQMQLQAKQAQQMQQQQEMGAANAELGAAFLEENALKEGVQVTDSGLQYKVLEPGEGPTPGPKSIATVHYRGTLIDGTEFDSSYERGEPATFPLSGVIPGWTEALQLMPVGSKYELVIPAELAYGEAGRPGIPPNSVLIFQVELLSFE